MSMLTTADAPLVCPPWCNPAEHSQDPDPGHDGSNPTARQVIHQSAHQWIPNTAVEACLDQACCRGYPDPQFNRAGPVAEYAYSPEDPLTPAQAGQFAAVLVDLADLAQR